MAKFDLADELIMEEEEFTAEPEGRSCAGLVLLTHGYNLKIIGEPHWTASMQQAIIKRLRSNGRVGKIKIGGRKNNLKVMPEWLDEDRTIKSDSDIILRIDWSEVANHLTSGISTKEIAAALLPVLEDERTGLPPLAEIPIHLIGHSRGASLVCELSHLLGEKGIKVDQVTLLDPHPLTEDDPQKPADEPVIDPPVQKYGNVGFMDNYWQDISYPRGEHVRGVFNRQWNKLPGGYHHTIHAPSGDHWNIILVYHGTITGKLPVNNGEAEFSKKEWQKLFAPMEDNGRKIGYAFSKAVNPELRPQAAEQT